jgi:hypothetical protein
MGDGDPFFDAVRLLLLLDAAVVEIDPCRSAPAIRRTHERADLAWRPTSRLSLATHGAVATNPARVGVFPDPGV